MSEFRCPKCDGPTYLCKADLRACRNCTNIFDPSDIDPEAGEDHLGALKENEARKAPKKSEKAEKDPVAAVEGDEAPEAPVEAPEASK